MVVVGRVLGVLLVSLSVSSDNCYMTPLTWCVKELTSKVNEMDHWLKHS